MGGEFSKPNPKNDNTDFYRVCGSRPEIHEAQSTTDYNDHRHWTTPITTNPNIGELERTVRITATDRPSSSSVPTKEVHTTLRLYPDLPEATYVDEVIFARNPPECRRQSIKRVQDCPGRGKTGGALASEEVNRESDRPNSSHTVDYLSGGTMKSQTLFRIQPSCPEYSLLDTLSSSDECVVSCTAGAQRSRGRDVCTNCAGNENKEFLCKLRLADDSHQRDSSPMDGEYSYASRQCTVGADRRRPNLKQCMPRKQVTMVDVNRGDPPPKYGDVLAQINAERKAETQKMSSRNNPGLQQSKASDSKTNNQCGKVNTTEDRCGTKTIDALNDLLKKEFGSVGQPTVNLPFVLEREKLFAGRNRLYVGNLPSNINRQDINELMAPYGEIVVDHHNSEKKFGFVTLKHRVEAENAQRCLDGYVFKGRTLRVRLANRNISFKVLNLDVWVTNELLKKAFSAFGEVERAEIVLEDAKPTGEGFLEFSDKRAGKMALAACADNCFLLTSSLRPVILREINPERCSRGYSERQINKNNIEYRQSREVGPRFVPKGSIENNCASLWKSFYERQKREEEQLARRMQLEENILEDQIRSIMTS